MSSTCSSPSQQERARCHRRPSRLHRRSERHRSRRLDRWRKDVPKIHIVQAGGSFTGNMGIPYADGICPDLVSPAANTIVVESPGGGDTVDLKTMANVGMYFFVDANQGAGFDSGSSDPYGYFADGEKGTLQDVGAMFDIRAERLLGRAQVVHRRQGKRLRDVPRLRRRQPLHRDRRSPMHDRLGHDLHRARRRKPDGAFSQRHAIRRTNRRIRSRRQHRGRLGLPATTTPQGGKEVYGVALSKDGGKTFSDISAPAWQTSSGGTYPPAEHSASTAQAHFGSPTLATTGSGKEPLIVDKSCRLGDDLERVGSSQRGDLRRHRRLPIPFAGERLRRNDALLRVGGGRGRQRRNAALHAHSLRSQPSLILRG